MSDDPGSPEATDPEATSPESAEAAVEEAEAVVDDAAAEAAEAAEPAAEDGLAAELAERTEDLQRVTAEYTNYRRRTERERQAAVEHARAGVVGQLLPILDDLELARRHGDLEDGPLKSFADKFRGTLDSLGLEAFGVEGEPFDPEIHEAVQDASTGDEKVLGNVLRQGFSLGGKTVRTAMVIIGDPQGDAPADDGDSENTEEA
ncbi:nucleotide exchange factor GrpE [Corynebacterium frankenforstense]|uniref:nucleotide exchange factor GrpE n=1 Tax=Corynebacterium frankenforstense TaxID=1230998 RepID=UPI00254A3C10|nr:nucleotide exchange factor GrpE [Corynebacterium frankenforstense]MDK6259511.1 nucleotide exchange factor GrpE [Corynebacterium frankenforstense]